MFLSSSPVQSHTMPLTDHSKSYIPDWLEFSLEAHNVQ